MVSLYLSSLSELKQNFLSVVFYIRDISNSKTTIFWLFAVKKKKYSKRSHFKGRVEFE